MDVVRAKEMRKLAAQFSRRSCPTACVQGRPVPCRATCEDGRCVDVNARALPAEGLPRRRAR